MNRRTFLRTTAALSAGAAATRVLSVVPPAHAQQKEFSPRPGTWRTFEMTTRVEILEPAGVMRAWLPIPSVKADYQKPLGDQWSGNAKVMKAVTDNVYGASMLYAEFAAGEGGTGRVAFDLGAPGYTPSGYTLSLGPATGAAAGTVVLQSGTP